MLFLCVWKEDGGWGGMSLLPPGLQACVASAHLPPCQLLYAPYTGYFGRVEVRHSVVDA